MSLVAPEVGRCLGERYELLRELGRGGMGVVYVARDRVLDREVALKLVARLKGEAQSRFEREARIVAKMDHPAIVPVWDFQVDGAWLFFVMPLIEGETLRDLLDRTRLSHAATLQVALQVAQALQYSHARGVIHRDVKPENVMVREVDGDLEVKVMDFGVALSSAEARITNDGALFGTPSYLSPEHVRGEAVDVRADVYSLGAVLYECLTGDPPFEGEVMSVLYRIVHERPASPALRSPGAPSTLVDLVMHCLEKLPERRPQSARDVLEALRSQQRRDSDEDAHPTIRFSPPPSSRERARGASDPPARPSRPPAVAAAASQMLGDLLLLHGEYVAAEEAFLTARDARLSAAEPIADADQAALLLRLANLAHKLGRYDEAIDRCTAALELLGEGEPALRGELCAAACLAACAMSRVDDAERWLRMGFSAIADAAVEPSRRAAVEARLFRSRGNVLLALSSPLEALEAFRQALSRSDATTDRWEHSIALFNVGEACSLAGKYAEASEHLDQAYAEKIAIGDRWGLAYTHHARAQIHLDRGDFAAATAEARAGARVAKELGDPKLRAMLHVVTSQVHLAEGRLEDAQRGFELALEDATACAARTDKVAALVGITETERARGRAPEALAAAQRAMAAAAELGPAERASALVAAAGAAILQRDANGRLRESSATHAERSLGEAARLWEGIGQPYRVLDVIEARVRLETARGRDSDAKRLARELIERARALEAGRHERAAAPLATAAPDPDQGA